MNFVNEVRLVVAFGIEIVHLIDKLELKHLPWVLIFDACLLHLDEKISKAIAHFVKDGPTETS